jgi:hypothetical protein
MKIYNFDSNGYLINESIAKIDPMESERQGKDMYILPKNATFIEPIEYNSELEILKFSVTDNLWLIEDIKLIGDYYLKSDGSITKSILKKELELYTNIHPNLELYEDKDENNNITQVSTISFIDGAWVYTSTTKSQLISVKLAKIAEVKQEAAKRIGDLYPQYKQNNIAAEVLQIQNRELTALKELVSSNEPNEGTPYTLTDTDKSMLTKAQSCNEFITLIRTKSDEIEQTINEKSNVDSVILFDITDNKLWSN